MDWVFREYSNPFSLLDSLIPNNRFSEWVNEFAKSHNEKLQWEFWLHKDFEHSWSEFSDGQSVQNSKPMSKKEMKSIVQNTYSMMGDFRLEEGDK